VRVQLQKIRQHRCITRCRGFKDNFTEVNHLDVHGLGAG
jgi:hypothetical protein